MTTSSFQNWSKFFNFPKPTFCESNYYIHEMCNLIVKNLLSQYIIFPPTREEQNVVKQGYTLY